MRLQRRHCCVRAQAALPNEPSSLRIENKLRDRTQRWGGALINLRDFNLA